MRISRELATELAELYNTLSTVTTSGDNTVRMANCLIRLRNILGQLEIISGDVEVQADDQ